MVSPDCANALREENAGPIPMIAGSTPADAPVIHFAMGATPSRFAASTLSTTTAAAPSLMPDALPAVTVPSF
jgi:hypothetical protein